MTRLENHKDNIFILFHISIDFRLDSKTYVFILVYKLLHLKCGWDWKNVQIYSNPSISTINAF